MCNSPISVEKARELSKDEKERLIKVIEQEAHDNEVLFWGCSQAVLGALQRHFNLGNSETFKAATAFAGGVGRSREACGALLGGVMAIGLVYGRAKFEDGKVCMEQPEFLEALVRASRLCDRFKEKFGSLRCGDIRISIRGDDYREYTRYNTLENFKDHDKCGDVTGPAARLAAEIILQPTEVFADEITAHLEDLNQVRQEQRNRLASR
ncbi:MAG: C-GCAxxG-C-C family protein [Candidatus Hodarchaeota archaeon]